MITGTRRRPGRPRSAAADRAILEAALEVFAEAGFDGLTVEEVAARAGVGKGTIYRRYVGKVELVFAATSLLRGEVSPSPDTGSVVGDLTALARGLVELLTSTPVGPATRQLVAEVGRSEELRRAHRGFVADRRARVIAAIRRGMERGELAATVDPELVADSIGGPIFYRFLVSGDVLDDAYVDRVVAAALGGVRA